LYTIRAFKKNDNKIQDDLNVLSFVDGILLTVGIIRPTSRVAQNAGIQCRKNLLGKEIINKQ
jgi:hypothetical protein